MARGDTVTLDGYILRRTTEKAIGVAKASVPFGRETMLEWIPRSCCPDGHRLEEGDTDLEVAEWKADELGLDY